MSRLAWLTPDQTTETRRCWRVFVPDDETMEAAFRGALQNLAIVNNWELYGNATPEDTAKMWDNANNQTFEMAGCLEANSAMAIGTIFAFPSETPPSGAVLCNGASYLHGDYPDLYTLIGTQFGGDSTHFNVPDLQGDFVRFTSDEESIGVEGGETEVTLTVAQLPAHQHLFNKGASSGGVPSSSPLAAIRKIGTWLTDTAGSNFAHENMPPYTALAPMIQAK